MNLQKVSEFFALKAFSPCKWMECMGLMTNGKKLQSKMRASHSQKSQVCSSAPGLPRRLLRGCPLWLQLHEEPAEKCSCNRYQFCSQGLCEHIRGSVLCSLSLPVPLLPAQAEHSHRWMLILWKGLLLGQQFRKHCPITLKLYLCCVFILSKSRGWFK